MAPALGDTITYQLSLDDARRVSAQRGTSATSARGNRHRVGDRLPLVVTAVAVVDGVPRVNGQVLLDGADQLWVTSAKEGDGPGQWQRRPPDPAIDELRHALEALRRPPIPQIPTFRATDPDPWKV